MTSPSLTLDRHREIARLREIGLSYEVIAQRLRVTNPTIWRHLHGDCHCERRNGARAAATRREAKA